MARPEYALHHWMPPRVWRDRPRRADSADDRGDTSILAAGLVVVLILALGLVVDGAGILQARTAARHAAEQAARVAGQELDTFDALTGGGIDVDLSSADRQARQTLNSLRHTGGLHRAGEHLEVTAHGSYRPMILRLVGRGAISVDSTAQVHLVPNRS